MKQLELPEAHYRIKKVKAHDKNAVTYVDVGNTYSGEFTPVITVGECFHFTGGSIRDYLRTSIVKEIRPKKGNKVHIITENSVYVLEEVLT